MPIICFEGASAVGKSSTSKLLKEKFNAFTIDEVNKLFERPNNAATTWYFERQVERVSIAISEIIYHEIVILDGDPFQPLWYNWCYDFIGWQPLEALDHFYREVISKGQIKFPDQYFYLHTDEEELRKRKEHDSNSKRANFEKHLQFIRPQRAYFDYMNQLEPTLVKFINATTVNNNAETIVSFLKESRFKRKPDLELYDGLIEWLKRNKASDFVSSTRSE